MSIETSTPVTRSQFFNRELELRRLTEIVSNATKGVRRWVALLGHRKIGKTSLLLEVLRNHGSRVVMPYVDCWEVRADPLFFLGRVIRAHITALIRRRGAEAEVGSFDVGHGGRLPARAVQALARLGCSALDNAVRLHEEVVSGTPSVDTVRQIFDLPGALAASLGEPVIVILDEFQELERLSRVRRMGGRVDDVFGLLRSVWQQQEGVSYAVAGSRLTTMRQILTDEASAFFQHFEIMELGPFERDSSLKMIEKVLGNGGKMGASPTVERVLDILGDHPFYVRALIQEVGPSAAGKRMSMRTVEQTMREALEASLFEQNGRLSLFMEQRYRVVVGESATLEAVLRGFVEPARITDVAEMLHIRTGAVSTAVKTLSSQDVLMRLDDGRYAVADPTFALWLKHQVDFRQAMPPLLVGTDSEQAVAQRLAADGFRGVYQSRASRGAFDLLAVHDTRVFGLQVKSGSLPYSLRSEERARLLADADRLGFHPVLALVSAGKVGFYDLRALRGKGSLRVREATPVAETLLALL